MASKPKVFIGSSKLHEDVASAIANGLEHDRQCAEATVWSEGVFRPNDNVLDRLLETLSEYDFAVMVWAPDDVIDSNGQQQASPRDNVIFECGLFMGALGKQRVFVVHDSQVKIPSDFAGITLVAYEGSRFKENSAAAVRVACDQIATAITNAPIKELIGDWRELYLEGEDIDQKPVTANIEIAAFADGISLTRYDETTKKVVFSGHGRLAENQIRGEWKHQESRVLDHGLFLLMLNTPSNVLYGYSSARDADGGTIFEAWVLAKKAGRTEAQITQLLSWGQKTLNRRTLSPPLVQSEAS